MSTTKIYGYSTGVLVALMQLGCKLIDAGSWMNAGTVEFQGTDQDLVVMHDLLRDEGYHYPKDYMWEPQA